MPSPPSNALWHVTLFGTLQASDPAGVRPPLTHFRTQRCAALLAFLVFYPGMHAREILAEMLWPDSSPEAGRSRLKQEIATLRRHIEPSGVLSSGSVLCAEGRTHIGLREGAVSTDVGVFESSLRRAATAPLEETLAFLQQAASLHGDPGLLPGRYEEWIESERERLNLLYANALRSIAGAKTPSDAEAWDAARRALRAAPNDEASHAALINLYLASGNQEAAQKQWTEWKNIAECEGLTPSPVLRDLVSGARAAQTVPATSWRIARAAPVSPAPLPVSLTRFFDREKEIDAIYAAFDADPAARLVTLSGQGGIGKTRLALEVARCLGLPNAPASAPPFAAVAFAPLAGVSEAGLLWNAVLSAVFPDDKPGITEDAPVVRLIHLLEACSKAHNERVLLVLDNFEQIADGGGPLLSPFLQNAPFVSLLVTSRRPLHLSGEREIPLGPLPVRGLKGTTSASVRLFADRVRASRPDFVLDARQAPTVEAICRYLEGFPLALELAAARVPVMRLFSLRDALQRNRLNPLISQKRDMPVRHQSLRNTLAWSFELLPPPAQKLWAHLSVFRSGWTMEAAQAVGNIATEAETLALLEVLYDYHLIQRNENEVTSEISEADGETRFSMLEILRQWASEQQTPGEQAETEARLVQYLLSLTARCDLEIRGEREAYWIARLDAEHDNLRAALVWGIHDAQTKTRLPNDPLADAALRICDEIAQYWWLKGHLREGRKWYKDVLDASHDNDSPREALSDALRSCAALALNQDDNDEARELASRALVVAQTIEHIRCEAYANGTLGRIALNIGDFQSARTHFERGTELLASYKETYSHIQNHQAFLWHNLGIALLTLGDTNGARNAYEKTMNYWRSKGMVHRSHIATSLDALAQLEWLAGNSDAARTLLQEADFILRSMNIKGNLSGTLLMRGRVEAGFDPSASRAFLREGLVLAQETDNRRVMVEVLEEMAAGEASGNRLESAAQLWGMASALRRVPSPIRASAYYHEAQETLRARVKETLKTRWDACEAQGRVRVLSASPREIADAALGLLE